MSAAMTKRSIRTIKAVRSREPTRLASRRLTASTQELEFLCDSDLITPQAMSSIIAQLPDESNPQAVRGSSVSTAGIISAMAQTSVQDNNYQGFYAPSPAPTNPSPTPQVQHQQQQQQYQQPPPAYPVAPTPGMQPLAHAVAMYVYNGTDVGDLNLMVNDRIALTEYLNSEWCKGRSERTGQEGIFPRSYVRIEEKMGAPPPQQMQMQNNYGNQPVALAQGPSGEPANNKYGDMSKRAGKKIGNAALHVFPFNLLLGPLLTR